jgi:hypothetical protein
MTLHMALMKKYKMIVQDDLEDFSEELQNILKEFEKI